MVGLSVPKVINQPVDGSVYVLYFCMSISRYLMYKVLSIDSGS